MPRDTGCEAAPLSCSHYVNKRTLWSWPTEISLSLSLSHTHTRTHTHAHTHTHSLALPPFVRRVHPTLERTLAWNTSLRKWVFASPLAPMTIKIVALQFPGLPNWKMMSNKMEWRKLLRSGNRNDSELMLYFIPMVKIFLVEFLEEIERDSIWRHKITSSNGLEFVFLIQPRAIRIITFLSVRNLLIEPLHTLQQLKTEIKKKKQQLKTKSDFLVRNHCTMSTFWT